MCFSFQRTLWMNWLQKEKKHKREMAAVQIEIVIHIFC